MKAARAVELAIAELDRRIGVYETEKELAERLNRELVWMKRHAERWVQRRAVLLRWVNGERVLLRGREIKADSEWCDHGDILDAGCALEIVPRGEWRHGVYHIGGKVAGGVSLDVESGETLYLAWSSSWDIPVKGFHDSQDARKYVEENC